MADRTFWRIVRTNPPAERDFLSHAALGRQLTRHDPDSVRLSQGISVFATDAQARRNARRYPVFGRWLVEVRIPGDAHIHIERTRGGPGHHTLWGEAATLLAYVVRVVPV
jgi:hypothetical protein